MKVIAFNGSPREKGNTFTALNAIGKQLEKHGIEFEIIHIGNKAIRGCIACGMCGKNQNQKCIFDDEVNQNLQIAKDADAIIIGSPVYFSGINGTMKSFLDRLFYVSLANGNLFRHKIGAAIAAVRRSGGMTTVNSLNHYFSISQMLIPTSNYWNVIHGTAEGEASLDSEGMQVMELLGDNMVWLLNLVKEGKLNVSEPENPQKIAMNFIRP